MVNPLTIIDEAVAWALTHIHGVLALMFGATSGWSWAGAIVLLVVLMRLVLVPLFIKQLHATRKMAALAPEIKELKKKYKNDKKKLNEETMALYKEHGANPLAGCLPLVAQMPLFIALFDVLRAIAEWTPGHPGPYGMSQAVVSSAQHAYIFGATVSDRFLEKLFPPTVDPHVPFSSQVVIFIFVAVSATTTFMTVRQSTKRGMNPAGGTTDNPLGGAQKYMVYFAPLFALSGLYWQFGLVLYWVTTNLWTLGQQHFLFKKYPMPKTDEDAEGLKAAEKPAPSRGGGPAAAPVRQPAGRATQAKTVTPKTAKTKSGAAKPGTGRSTAAAAGGVKPAEGKPGRAKPAAGAAGGAKPAGAKPRSAAGEAGDAKGDGAKSNGAKPAAGTAGGAKSSGAKPGAGQSKPGGRTPRSGSSGGSGASGLRRLVRGRSEPEPEPAAPETKYVRQQRVHQSRSKRSGKR